MKTKPMAHQVTALDRMVGKRAFALFMEQGTGKTWTLLADAERLYAKGAIDAVLVVAPKGVHTNWVRREIPAHMEGDIIARYWIGSGTKKAAAYMEAVMKPRPLGDPPPLRIFSINIDAVVTKAGEAFVRRFLNATKCLMILDESSRIKNPAAVRTKKLLKLRELAKGARIATGTPITAGPPDVFSQMEFLASGLLGTTSYRAFVAEYSDLMDPTHPMMKKMIERNPKAAMAQIVKRDPVTNAPIYRNLAKLTGLLEPHSFRVLKRECLDLPEKIYKNHFFELTNQQRAAYDLLEEELRLQLVDGTIAVVQRLPAMMKLQQITSGYFIPPRPKTPEGEAPAPTAPPQYIEGDNPRLDALMELLEDIDGKFIIWARFREEMAAIERRMAEAEIPWVSYHGGVNASDREKAVDSFQSGEARAFIGNPQAGGIGLTLTAAETVIYYSNDFGLENRLQSEDRAHRIGTKKNVVYIDIVATETIDEAIARALQRKEDVAANILGDRFR